jgi:hypothetical protein
MKSGSLNLLEPSGPRRACYGTPLSFTFSKSSYIDNSAARKSIVGHVKRDIADINFEFTHFLFFFLNLLGTCCVIYLINYLLALYINMCQKCFVFDLTLKCRSFARSGTQSLLLVFRLTRLFSGT